MTIVITMIYNDCRCDDHENHRRHNDPYDDNNCRFDEHNNNNCRPDDHNNDNTCGNE